MRLPSYQLSHQMREHNKYEDILDVFINFLIKRSPTGFILINMTLMIWLVQTIFSSHSDTVPRSIYYYAPFFNAQPIINIQILNSNTQCSKNFQKIYLKTFATIKQNHINHKNLTNWFNKPIIFCVQKSHVVANFSITCQSPKIYCSGYCVDNIKQCPITSIKKILLRDPIPNQYQYLYTINDRQTQYIFSRSDQNSYLVGLSAQFQQQCSNDYRYYDKYETFTQYWNQTHDCGSQGKVSPEIYHSFDYMLAKDFLFANDLWTPDIENLGDSQASLGTVSLIRFNNKTLECNQAEYLSRKLSNQLLEDAVKPTFNQSMLIIAFVFFTGGWGWLIGYYCFQGLRKQKNMIVILMCIIELIVICFLYIQNIQMFHTQQLILKISTCIETPIQATSNWKFGITNSSPFLSIMYLCICFLLFQIVANFMDRKIYVNYYNQQNGNVSNIASQ